MHMLIVDDEPLARQRLIRMIEQLDGYEVVGEASNGVDAVAAVDKFDPDIVLLDIRMPGEDGLETARKIAQLPEPPAIIFCTAYDEYALEAFQTLAVGYLLKPVQQQQLVDTLQNAMRLNKVQRNAVSNTAPDGQRQHITAKTRKGMELIPIASIQCFIADQKYVTVRHSAGETLIDDTLKELEQEFPDRFLRVHRNALVSISEIEAMERNNSGQFELRLKSVDYRPVVSRRHVSSVRELLSRL
ncbi:LytR/AlgR family response regulator transcription factor [Teredinibacter turnerae]|uniref:Positive alginate biosynthesis regulatory protein n=1 Tax=Teredinibacter turnerae (strain ATCC 39867 / T7901) TaxID=377629 RepID=C5BLH5_TERTT|nr:LytTR family DNA-binding domain-containing protein [Teredinibacter turnerae]ACR14582.1 positive alginate biosynthesis regulatory protein [Teredinibacter turnerae T7901]